MRLYFEAYGCTMNQGESKLMQRWSAEAGHEIVESPEKADAIVFSGCIVIDHTYRHMMKRLRELKSYEKKMIVSGCLASVFRDEVLKLIPDATIIPTWEIEKITDYLGKADAPKPFRWGVIGIIPIAQGCMGNCTYCITKIARRELRSAPHSWILRTAEEMLRSGVKEIELTAQDSAVYGLDTHHSLPELMRDINDIEGDFRVRVGMMNPDAASRILDELIEAYKLPRIYKFLHLPVQSGDDGVLKDMKRNYTVQEFMDIVDRFREEIPEITISTDIIVGYPTESEEAFERSVELIKEIRPNIVNITRFSPRPFTDAYKLKSITPRIVKERSRILTNVAMEISREINGALIGRRKKILITEKGKNDTLVGRTDEYVPVVVKQGKIGEVSEVEIVGAEVGYVIGDWLKI